jgi:hypothetical protein
LSWENVLKRGERLVGDREAVEARTPTLDHIVIDSGAQVAEDARAIPVLRQRVPVVAFVNNPFAGYAPETVRPLVELADFAASAQAERVAAWTDKEIVSHITNEVLTPAGHSEAGPEVVRRDLAALVGDQRAKGPRGTRNRQAQCP